MEPVSFDLQPTLTGDLVQLRPLRPDDWDDLFAVASDPLIWEQHPANDRYKEDVFRIFFREALECRGAFVVLDRTTSRIIGSTRFNGFDPQQSEIEIGWTFLSREYWGGAYNREMKRLLVNHAFRFVDKVAFYVGEHNMRSRKAMEKIGGIAETTVQRLSRGTPITNIKYVIKRPPGASFGF